jgi:hypothetical protein
MAAESRSAIRPRNGPSVALIWLSTGMFDASEAVFSMGAEDHHWILRMST